MNFPRVGIDFRKFITCLPGSGAVSRKRSLNHASTVNHFEDRVHLNSILSSGHQVAAEQAKPPVAKANQNELHRTFYR
jgi:hypothetical protein